MGWSGGTYSRVHDWAADAAGAIDIEAVRMDQEDDSIATGIDTCLTKDGQNTPTADLPMDSNKHTGVGNATAKNNYASAADVIDQDLIYYVDSGAADAYVLTPSPSISAYEEGQRLVFRCTNTNTGTSTLNANALGTRIIYTADGNILAAGMLIDGGIYEVTYDANPTPDRWVLTSPHSLIVKDSTNMIAGAGMTGGGTLAADRTFNVIAGTGITVNANDIDTNDSEINHDSLLNFAADEHIAHSGVSMTAGTGMTGGGTIASSRTLNVIGGTGITANANDIATDDSAIVHDNLSGFVSNEHINHGSVTMTAGTGMTGGGTIAASRTLNVAAGLGIAVNANDVQVEISALTAIQADGLASTDGFLVDNGGVPNRMEYTDAGVRVENVSGTTDTLATANMNTFIHYSNGSAVTVTLNTGVGEVGNFILIKQGGAGQVTVSGTATLESTIGNNTRTQESVITLFCQATNTWAVYGDQGA